MCLCTYSDKKRALSFPLTYRWVPDNDCCTQWFARHSDENGFCLLFWKWVDTMDRAESYSFLEKPIWAPLCDRSECSLYDVYLSYFPFYVYFSEYIDERLSLADVLGVGRDTFISMTRKPTRTHLYCKWYMPKSILKECYLIRDKLPLFIRVDEYDNCNHEDIHVFYNLKNSLFFICENRQRKLIIEY